METTRGELLTTPQRLTVEMHTILRISRPNLLQLFATTRDNHSVEFLKRIGEENTRKTKSVSKFYFEKK